MDDAPSDAPGGSPDDGPGGDAAFVLVEVPERGRFELLRDGERVGFAEYRLDDGVMVVPYVETAAHLRGHGIGAVIVEHVAAVAIERGVRIRPLCGFAAGELRRRPDAATLLV